MTRWRCRAYRAALVDRAEGTLSGRRQRRVQRHLPTCGACRDELTALREIPPLLRTLEVPEPGEEFWRHQRQALGDAIRRTDAPRPLPQAHWPQIGWPLPAWRYPVAVAAGLLAALGLYRFAVDRTPQAPSAIEHQLAELDTDSLALLHDVMRALEPADEPAVATEPDDSTLLAAAPLSDFAAVPDLPPVLHTGDLSDNELDGLDTLIGDEFG